jgi:glycosyltransferase involved in cell wall biosynthesis
MRVLFVTNSFPPSYTGGAEVANYHTCRALIREGIACSVLALNNRVPEKADEWYELDGIPVHRVVYQLTPRSAATDVFDWHLYRAAKRELRHLQPDLVHIHNVSGATLAPYLASRTLGVPVVNTLHDLWLLCPNNMLYRRDGSFCDPQSTPLDCKHCYRRYDHWGNVPYRRRLFAGLTANVKSFICPSQAVIDCHVQAGYAADRFCLVRLGLADPVPGDVPELRSLAISSARQEAIVSAAGCRTVVFAGGGIEIKGAEVLLQALPLLLQSGGGLRVLVAGGGEGNVLARFRQYAPAVQMVGVLPPPAMSALFALADLTIVPSIVHENSPVVIYESYQAGTPVVGSRIGGIPELIREGETGYLFRAGDASALAQAILAHFARPAQERRWMRQRCVKEVRTRFTLQQHVEGIKKVYLEALNG